MIEAQAQPHSIEAEEAFLGAALSDKSAVEWGLSVDLTPDDFYRRDHQHVWRAMTKLYERNQPVDIVSVADVLLDDGDIQYPASLLSDISKSSGHVWNHQHYGSVIKDKALRRNLLDAASDISALAYSSEDFLTIIDRAERTINKTRSKSPDQGRNPDPTDIIARLEGQKVKGVKTRWPALNSLALGGMTRGHLWVIGGFSSTGKSAVLTNLVEDVVNAGFAGMVASTEMTTEQYMLRMLAITSGVPQGIIRMGGMTLEQSALYEKAKTFWSTARVKLFDDLYTVARIRIQAKRIREQQGLDVLFVDFLQNLNETGDEIKDARSSIIALQQLAKELDICVVALSQVSNAMAQQMSESGVSGYYAFRGSGSVKDAADLAIMLDRDRVNTPDVMTFNVVKNRHGAIGKFGCWFDLPTGLLRQMTDEEMAEKDPNSGRKGRRKGQE